jgi:DNA-binding beta-propeller fold protein YncE
MTLRSTTAGRRLAIVLLATLAVTLSAAAQAQTKQATAPATPSCAPANGARFICGVNNVEDFAPIAHTRWVIGSDLAAASAPQGTLFLFDTGIRTATAVPSTAITIAQDNKTYLDCPGPPDWTVFGPHGLDLTREVGAHPTLYAVNHGGREAIEVFTVDLTKERPGFIWIGCVLAPAGFWPDAVASLPDGGIIVTSLWDPTDADRVTKLSSGQPVGGLDEWHPGKGWTQVPGATGLSGPNGVIVSSDGKEIYVAVWSGKELAKIARGPAKPKVETVPTEILTDNVRWSPDGQTIYAGGQDATVQQVLECFESTAINCNVPTKVYAVDPRTLKLTTLVKSGVYGVFGTGTGAIRVGNDLWVSSFRSDRIAIFPVK